MDIKIVTVLHQGDEKKEYIVLQALDKCNLKPYMILDNTYDTDGVASNKHRHVFKFPDWTVEKNEYIFLTTKPGLNKKGQTNTKEPASYLYWGLNSSVWNQSGDKVHLVKITDSTVFNVPSVV